MLPMSAADLIADAISDLRARRWVDPWDAGTSDMIDLMAEAVVIDCTPIHHSLHEQVRDGMNVYDDTTMRPPWMNALFAYPVNTTTELPDGPMDMVYLIHLTSLRAADLDVALRWQPTELDEPQEHTIDWDDVEWVIVASLHAWHQQRRQVAGPVHGWKAAVDADGRMLDLAIITPTGDMYPDFANNPLLVFLSALTFLNCRNVTLVEPTRSRAQRRRFERDGITISEIHVFPSGTSVRGHTMPVGAGGTPLHSVRGHVARYGPKWGRGLLFGRIEGEFWIPQHARGAAERGTVEQTFTLHD